MNGESAGQQQTNEVVETELSAVKGELGAVKSELGAVKGELSALKRKLRPERWLEENIASLTTRRVIWDPCVAAAARSTPLMLSAEVGLRVEQLAECVHELSGRQGPFLRFDCARVDAPLHLRELFGAAGDDATESVIAGAGVPATVFLGSVDRLSIAAQEHVLHSLSQQTGPRFILHSDANLADASRRGSFSAQLLARLAKNLVPLAPLRQRRAEVPVLAQRALVRAAEQLGSPARQLGEDAVRLLGSYEFPGNTDELFDLMAKAASACRESTVQPVHLGGLVEPGMRPSASGDRTATVPYRDAKERAVRDFEQQYFETLLARTGNNVSEAARQAGLDRSNFRRALRRAGLRTRARSAPGLAKPKSGDSAKLEEDSPSRAVGDGRD